MRPMIQKHRGKPLLFHYKCPGFLYVHYTTHGPTALRPIRRTKQLWLSVLDTSAATGQAGIRTHILTPLGHDTPWLRVCLKRASQIISVTNKTKYYKFHVTNHKGNWLGTFLDKFWINKDKFTRVGYEPATSGLTRRIPTELTSPILAVSLCCQYLCSQERGGGGASQKSFNIGLVS